jgi:tripartite-type tricarboxylate transporter receptor subunit TctC
MRLRFLAWMFAIGALAMSAARAQDFPSKPIRIVTGAPGGSSDFTARLIAQGLTENLRQQVIVDNRGNVDGELVAKAPPDGYTLVIDGASIWIGPLVQKAPYDPVRDFAPVTLAVSAPNVVIVQPSIPVKSIRELIALAKAQPGKLNYSSGGIGASSHLAAELFKSMAGVAIVNVNYKGTGPALNALIANEVQVMFVNPAIASPHIKSERVRALAVASLGPSPLMPDLPTVAAAGLPGFESVVLQGMFAPAGTPPARVTLLSREIAKVLNRPDVKERHFNTGVETVASTPEELAARIKSEMAKWGKVIRDAGIRPDKS